MEDEDRNVFDLEEAASAPVLHKSLSSRKSIVEKKRRRSTVTFNLPEAESSAANANIDPVLVELWNGKWKDAEVRAGCTKSTSSVSAMRWLMVPFHKFLIHNDPVHLDTVLERTLLAEKVCNAQVRELETKPHNAFVKKRFGFIKFYQLPSNLDEDEEALVRDWTDAFGIRAFIVLVRAFVYLLKGHVIHVLLQFIGVRCTTFSGIEILASMNKQGDESQEVMYYCNLVHASQLISVSMEEFRPDRSKYMKQAFELVNQTLVVHPKWVLYKWLGTHIARRLGKPQEAMTMLQQLVRTGTLCDTMTLELGCIAFSQRAWKWCKQILLPLVERQSGEPMVYVIMSAAIAMQEFVYDKKEDDMTEDQIVASVEMLEQGARKVPPRWGKKFKMLQFRPHKTTLYYELCYHCGFMQWYDLEVSGTLRDGGKVFSQEWLTRAERELRDMYQAAEISVVHPDSKNTRNEAAEEMLSLSVLYGSVLSMQGRLDEAKKRFQFVLDNVTTATAKNGIKDDPWHEAFALYELAVIKIRTGEIAPIKEKSGEYTSARMYLLRAAKMHGFVFRPQLVTKIKAALEYLSFQKSTFADFSMITDELGSHIVGYGAMHIDTDTAPDLSRTNKINIAGGTVFQTERVIKKEQQVKWSWGVNHGSLLFRVDFVKNSALDEKEEIVAPITVETAVVNEGFYIGTEDGILKFSWDNMQSAHLEKRIFFSCY